MKNKKAFTLIELMVVISIWVLLMIWIYAPYNYYSNKAKLKVAKTQIAKTIYEARNMAIYWLDQGKNRSIWVYFDNSSDKKNKVFIYSYPYDYSWIKNDFISSDVKLIKKVILEPWIEIIKINSQNNALFYFEAISGSWSYYYYNPTQNSFLSDKLNIKIAFKNWWENLKTSLTYFTKTNIVDY